MFTGAKIGKIFRRTKSVLVLGEELHVPFAVELLGAQKTDLRIEKHVELLYPHMEKTCEEKMPELVYQHEKTQG